MIAMENRESVIQNLEDAGCKTEMIRAFLGWFDKGQKSEMEAVTQEIFSEEQISLAEQKVCFLLS